MNNTKHLTYSQIKRKVTAAGKKWIITHGYEKDLKVQCIKGIFHIDNCGNYLLTAKEILTMATGLELREIGTSAAKLANY